MPAWINRVFYAGFILVPVTLLSLTALQHEVASRTVFRVSPVPEYAYSVPFGVPGARHTLVVMSSINCAYCRKWFAEIWPTLEPDLASGNLRVVVDETVVDGEGGPYAGMRDRDLIERLGCLGRAFGHGREQEEALLAAYHVHDDATAQAPACVERDNSDIALSRATAEDYFLEGTPTFIYMRHRLTGFRSWADIQAASGSPETGHQRVR